MKSKRLSILVFALFMAGLFAPVAFAGQTDRGAAADHAAGTQVNKDNPNEGAEPGCNPSGQQPKKCDEEPPPCPDGDDDGVCDDDDDCPEDTGPASNNGCPEEQPCPDGDDDGVCDADDDCPEDAGPASNGGCPLPPPAKRCTAAAGDPGLLTSDTEAKTLHEAGLKELPIVVNPVANGAISKPLHDGGEDTALEVVTDAGSCAASLPALGL